MHRTLSIGAIGFGNHAARMLRIAESTGLARITHLFHPQRPADDPRAARALSDLRGCDAVLILSPNATHHGYLEAFAKGYDGYVFCEKPPVTTRHELDAVERLGLSPGRTYFNFNLRQSSLVDVLSRHTLGNLVSGSALVTHGLAFRASYPNSWRADAARHRHGVAETAAIHYLDLFTFIFGAPREIHYFPAILSGVGTAFDTCRLLLRFEGGATCDVVASYAAPHRAELCVLGTEAVVTFRDGRLELRGPRSTFGPDGMFADPPVVEAREQSPEAMYIESLERSMRYFLECCAERRPFPERLFFEALATNRRIINLDER